MISIVLITSSPLRHVVSSNIALKLPISSRYGVLCCVAVCAGGACGPPPMSAVRSVCGVSLRVWGPVGPPPTGSIAVATAPCVVFWADVPPSMMCTLVAGIGLALLPSLVVLILNLLPASAHGGPLIRPAVTAGSFPVCARERIPPVRLFEALCVVLQFEHSILLPGWWKSSCDLWD
jgi:hypothetical protein